MASPIALSVQLFIDGVWTTYPGYVDAGWSTAVGPGDSRELTASSIEYQFQNPTRDLDPYNAAGALYGKIGRNTKARIVRAGLVMTQAEASDWSPDTSDEFSVGGKGRSWTDFTAEGLIRRLGKWDEPVRSPMFRQISSYTTSSGYWPLEDPSGSTRLSVQVAGARFGTWTGTVNLGGNDGAGGSDETVTLGSDGLMVFGFKSTSANGYQICWATQLAATPTAATLPLFSWADTAGRTWTWSCDSTTFTVSVVAQDGTTLYSGAVGWSPTPVTNWVRYRVKVTVSGSVVTLEPAWYDQDGAVITGFTGTFAGTSTGQPRTARIAGNANTANAGYGHVFAMTNTTLDLLGDYGAYASFNGYINEAAGRRFLRLLTEQGLVGYVIGDPDKTIAMGRQKPGQLLDLIKQCADTDGGLVYDELFDIALTLCTRLGMTNVTPSLTLTKGVDIASPLVRKIDDVGVVNSVTVQNLNGDKASSRLTSGALSVLAPPSGVGEYKGGNDLDINMASADGLQDRADWLLARGTIDKPRYKQVVVDLLANPGYVGTVTGIRPGAWITVAGAEPDPISLVVVKKTISGGAIASKVVFECVAADIYQVAKSDSSTDAGDSLTSTTNAGFTSTATTFTITTANPKDVWSTTRAYDLAIAGERIGIPSGGVGAATGAGPYLQVVTGAVRSKNGVVKAQLAGAAVHVAYPVRTTL